MDTLLDRIDFEKIAEKSNIEAIIARSSSGLCLQFVDIIRIRIVILDLFVQRLARGTCCRKHENHHARQQPKHECAVSRDTVCQQSPTNRYNQRHRDRVAARIVEVQGCYSGLVSRALSWFLDEMVVVGTFGLGTLCANGVARLVTNGKGFEMESVALATILYSIWGVQYRALSLLLTQRTLGMLVLGLKLVNHNGTRPHVMQILLRQVLQPWLAIFFFVGGPATFLAWQRQDGRFIHDLLTNTGFVYKWNVKMAKLRLERTEDASVFDDSGLVTEV